MSPKTEHNKVCKSRVYGYSCVVVLHLKELTDCPLIFNTAVCFTRFKHLNLKGSGHRLIVFYNQSEISQQRPGAPSTGHLLNKQEAIKKKKTQTQKRYSISFFPQFNAQIMTHSLNTREKREHMSHILQK